MRKIPLGSNVRFWQRASKLNGNGPRFLRDVTESERWRVRRLISEQGFDIGGHNTTETSVIRWDDEGEGVVVGFTYRHQGRHEWEDGFFIGLSESGPRVPLYQVKSRLSQGKPYLVPIHAIEWLDNCATFRRHDPPAAQEDYTLLVPTGGLAIGGMAINQTDNIGTGTAMFRAGQGYTITFDQATVGA